MISRFFPAKKNVPAILIIATFVLQIFFFAPLQVLVQNIGEFSVSYFDILLIYSVISILFCVLIGLGVRLLNKDLFLPLLAYLSLVAFLESRFLVALAQHSPFDGKLIDWQALQWVSVAEVVTILVLAIVFWVLRRRTQLFSAVSLFILLFLSAGLLYNTATHIGSLLHSRQAENTQARYFDQFYRLSSKRNIVHIVPDQAQGAMLHEILTTSSEHYSTVLDGFTLFTQSTGAYKSTYPSVVYYMAGEAPESEFDLVQNQPYTRQYIEETLRERSIVTELSKDGFRTFGFQFNSWIFCGGNYTACTGTHAEVFDGIDIPSPAKRLADTVLAGLDLGLFQLAPIVLRERIFNNGDWFLKRLSRDSFAHSGILDLFMDKMQVEDSAGSYNYFHHAGAHAPLLFDRNCSYVGPQEVEWENQREQVMCTLVQLEEMILALKRAGVYDQTMIIINGDHGTPWLPESYPGQSGKVIPKSLIGMASTLMLVKPPGARGPLKYSELPVTIGDIPATIADAFGLDARYDGISMLVDEPITDRERSYYNYEMASKTHFLEYLPDLTRYRIRGDVFDEGDWILPNAGVVDEHLTQLRMDNPQFTEQSLGFSWLEQLDVPVRWVDGTKAWVFLMPPQQTPVALVFESYVPPNIEGQWMEVSVEGKVIARLDEDELRESRHTVPLTDDLLDTDVMEIEFTLGKTMSPENDSRKLSVLFRYIGLVPAG